MLALRSRATEAVSRLIWACANAGHLAPQEWIIGCGGAVAITPGKSEIS